MAFENYDDIRPKDVIEIFEREEVRAQPDLRQDCRRKRGAFRALFLCP